MLIGDRLTNVVSEINHYEQHFEYNYVQSSLKASRHVQKK